jgi:hypothetical protein
MTFDGLIDDQWPTPGSWAKKIKKYENAKNCNQFWNINGYDIRG